jgi:hypothetical protein
MTTQAWEGAKDAVLGAWRRLRPDRAATVEAELVESRADALAAQEAGDTCAVQDLTEEWQARLGRMLAADPHAASDLLRALEGLAQRLPDADRVRMATVNVSVMTEGSSQANVVGTGTLSVSNEHR